MDKYRFGIIICIVIALAIMIATPVIIRQENNRVVIQGMPLDYMGAYTPS